jgi:hypothetical protein
MFDDPAQYFTDLVGGPEGAAQGPVGAAGLPDPASPEGQALTRRNAAKFLGVAEEAVKPDDVAKYMSFTEGALGRAAQFFGPESIIGRLITFFGGLNLTQKAMIGGALLAGVVGIGQALAGNGSKAALSMLGALGLAGGAYAFGGGPFKGLVGLGPEVSPGDPTAAAGGQAFTEGQEGWNPPQGLPGGASAQQQATESPGGGAPQVPSGTFTSVTEMMPSDMEQFRPASLAPGKRNPFHNRSRPSENVRKVDVMLAEAIHQGLPADAMASWNNLSPAWKAMLAVRLQWAGPSADDAWRALKSSLATATGNSGQGSPGYRGGEAGYTGNIPRTAG